MSDWVRRRYDLASRAGRRAGLTPEERLAASAIRVGAALDIHMYAVPVPGTSSDLRWPPVAFKPSVLASAEVTLPEGVRVAHYERATSPDRGKFKSLPGDPIFDLWQVCLQDREGNWVTYGDTSGVQQTGVPQGKTCRFSKPTGQDTGFDARMFAGQVWRVAFRNADPLTLDEQDQQRLGVRLGEGWRASKVEKNGYTSLQYCLSTRAGEWFHVYGPNIENHGMRGDCPVVPKLPFGE